MTAGGDVGEVMLVGKRGDKAVTLTGEFSGNAPVGIVKARQDEQAPGLQWLFPLRLDPLGQRASGTNNDWRRAAQEDPEKFFFPGE